MKYYASLEGEGLKYPGNIRVLFVYRSVGVLAYVMLTGYSPFAGDTKQEMFLNISQVNLDFPDDLFGDITPFAVDFMTKLLVREPKYVNLIMYVMYW